MLKQLLIDKAKDQMFSTILLLISTAFLFYKTEKNDKEKEMQIMKLEAEKATLRLDIERMREERDRATLQYYEAKAQLGQLKK